MQPFLQSMSTATEIRDRDRRRAAALADKIAVALRILTTLPEGRRVTYLAPYSVSLQSTVSGIRWRDGSSIAVDFTTTSDTERVDTPLGQRQGQRPE